MKNKEKTVFKRGVWETKNDSHYSLNVFFYYSLYGFSIQYACIIWIILCFCFQMPRFKPCIFYIFQLSTFLHFPFPSGFPNYVFLVLLSPIFIWMHNSNQNIIVIKDDNMQGNSQIGFWRCLISCLLHYIH